MNVDDPGAPVIRPKRKKPSIRIRIGVPPRTSTAATADILEAILEEIFPYEVEQMPATTRKIFREMAAKDGTFDIHPEVWLPTNRALYRKFVEAEQTVRLNKNGIVGLEGFCIPGYVADRYDIKHVHDLRSPTIARIFRSAAGGSGRLWVGASEWSQTLIARVKARDYGIARRFDLWIANEADFLQYLERKLDARQPVVFACYAPHWLIDKYDLAVLNEPSNGPGCYDIRDPGSDEDRYRDSTAKCRSPIPKLHVAFSARLESEAPDVARFLSELSLGRQAVNRWITELQEARRQPASLARTWIYREFGPMP